MHCVLAMCDQKSGALIRELLVMCHDKSQFINFVPFNKPEGVTVGDGCCLKGLGLETVMLNVNITWQEPKVPAESCAMSPTW